MTAHSRTFGLVIAVIVLTASTLIATAQDVEVPPFDWSTAVWSDQDGGYCNPGGLCAAPRDLVPPSFGQYCASAWCSFPTWALGYQLGLYGGIGGGGGGCRQLPTGVADLRPAIWHAHSATRHATQRRADAHANW